jgi:hypothetical protein
MNINTNPYISKLSYTLKNINILLIASTYYRILYIFILRLTFSENRITILMRILTFKYNKKKVLKNSH